MAMNLRGRLAGGVWKVFKTDKFDKLRDLIQRIEKFETPQRFKGTIVEKWGMFWKQLFLDYRDVAVDVCKEFKERPVKSCFYVTMISSGIYLAKHNPDETSFREYLLNCCSDMNMVGDPIQNKNSLAHLQWLNECYSEGIIRRLNLGTVSVIWLDNYKEGLALYKAICPYLKPRYFTFYERIIDVGFLDTWWMLRNKMTDYDVNEEEWSISPQPT